MLGAPETCRPFTNALVGVGLGFLIGYVTGVVWGSAESEPVLVERRRGRRGRRRYRRSSSSSE